jgi:uracil phosphoribosyltransferase
MRVTDLSSNNSVLNTFVAELRDIDIQHDQMRFRNNLVRIGEIMAYEISKTLNYKEKSIQTPLAQHQVDLIRDQLVTATILRAGLPFHQGFLNFFDDTQNAFVSAFRKYTSKEQFDIQIEYISSPHINGKTLILADPMLATGSSFELAYKALLTKGKPEAVHFACVVASADGLAYLEKIPELTGVHIWCAAVDPELNNKSYIVPGLGDAGDLAFGLKD